MIILMKQNECLISIKIHWQPVARAAEGRPERTESFTPSSQQNTLHPRLYEYNTCSCFAKDEGEDRFFEFQEFFYTNLEKT